MKGNFMYTHTYKLYIYICVCVCFGSSTSRPQTQPRLRDRFHLVLCSLQHLSFCPLRPLFIWGDFLASDAYFDFFLSLLPAFGDSGDALFAVELLGLFPSSLIPWSIGGLLRRRCRISSRRRCGSRISTIS